MFGVDIKKVGRMFSGQVNDAIDAAGDPASEARQIIREYNAQIAQAESSLVDVKARQILSQNEVNEHQAEVDKWTKSAGMAVQKGDDALARRCLEAKNAAKTKLDSSITMVTTISASVTELESRISELRDRAKKAEQTTEVLAARNDVANASLKTNEILAGIGNKNLDGDLASLETRVAKKEARAQAAAGMADHNSGADLDREVAKLNAASSIDDELAALKEATK